MWATLPWEQLQSLHHDHTLANSNVIMVKGMTRVIDHLEIKRVSRFSGMGNGGQEYWNGGILDYWNATCTAANFKLASYLGPGIHKKKVLERT